MKVVSSAVTCFYMCLSKSLERRRSVIYDLGVERHNCRGLRLWSRVLLLPRLEHIEKLEPLHCHLIPVC